MTRACAVKTGNVLSYSTGDESANMKATSQLSAGDRFAYPIAEIPTLSGIGRTSIYGAISDGKLRAVKHGRRTLVLAEDLKQWLAELPAMNPKPKNKPTATAETRPRKVTARL